MDEACAEGIGDEHYRLEGRPPDLCRYHPCMLNQLISANVLFCFEREPAKILFTTAFQGFVWFFLVVSFPPAPHPFSKPQQCADKVPFTFPPASPLPPSPICPSPHGVLVHSSMFFPQCDMILD